MKKEFAFTLFSLFFVLFFSSCTENKNSDDVVTFWVNSSRAECSAGAGLKQCLQVYKGDDPSSGEWEFFYEEIKGFEFESGYFQKLEVKKTAREKGKVPMDASTLEYTLIKVLKKMEDPLFALDGKWMATSIAGKELTDETTMPVLQVDLAKMMIAGSNGCNNYNGGINTLTESAIELGNIASTKKMCMDMSIPDSYDQALNNTATYKMTDGELAFMGKDGATIVSFIKAE
jgi:heat shock protein HslJ